MRDRHGQTVSALSLVLLISALACAPSQNGHAEVISIPSTAESQPSTYVIHLSAVAADDSSCVVAWVDQAETKFSVWTARCLIKDGEMRWVGSKPDPMSVPRANRIGLVGNGGSTGLLYLAQGTLLFRPDIGRETAIAINPDSDYVRNFAAIAHNGTLSVVCIANVSQGVKTYIDALTYDVTDHSVSRQKLARLWLTGGWSVPLPSIRAEADSMRIAIGLDHGGLEGQTKAERRDVEFLFSSRANGTPEWPRLTEHLRRPELSQTTDRQIGSFAALPGQYAGAILSNAGLHLLRSDNNTFSELNLGSREASGDAFGHPRVAAEAIDDSSICLAWIDAERQMLSGGFMIPGDRSSTFYGGDIKYARLNTQQWTLGPVQTFPLPKGGTAEALTMTHVGSQLVLVWAGPLHRIVGTDQRQFVSAAIIQP